MITKKKQKFGHFKSTVGKDKELSRIAMEVFKFERCRGKKGECMHFLLDKIEYEQKNAQLIYASQLVENPLYYKYYMNL